MSTSYTAQFRRDHWPPWLKFVLIGAVFTVTALILLFALRETDPDLTPVAEPRSGAILSGIEDYNGSEITIKASGGSSCVVKLKTRSGVERLSFYVREGETVTVGVPREHLYVYFASGDTWYGMEHLFGKTTSYSMDDEIIDFDTYTMTYTLYPVSNGNFSQTRISADEFK